MIKPFNNSEPKIHESAYVADDAIIIGDVEIGADASRRRLYCDRTRCRSRRLAKRRRRCGD